jgi:hypothetical protein
MIAGMQGGLRRGAYGTVLLYIRYLGMVGDRDTYGV